MSIEPSVLPTDELLDDLKEPIKLFVEHTKSDHRFYCVLHLIHEGVMVPISQASLVLERLNANPNSALSFNMFADSDGLHLSIHWKDFLAAKKYEDSKLFCPCGESHEEDGEEVREGRTVKDLLNELMAKLANK